RSTSRESGTGSARAPAARPPDDTPSRPTAAATSTAPADRAPRHLRLPVVVPAPGAVVRREAHLDRATLHPSASRALIAAAVVTSCHIRNFSPSSNSGYCPHAGHGQLPDRPKHAEEHGPPVCCGQCAVEP